MSQPRTPEQRVDEDEQPWSEGQFVDNVRRVVRVLMAIRDVDAHWLGEQLGGLDRNTIYSRMGSGRPTRFTAAEIYRMGIVFNVPASVFFAPVEDLLANIRKPGFFPHHGLAA